MLLLVVGAAELHAQTPAAPPAGMTQEQFDALVDAISKSVAEKLKADGVQEPAAAAAKPKSGKGAPAAKAEIVKIPPKEGPGEFAIFLQRAGKVVAAFPALGRQFDRIGGGLDQGSTGGWGIVAFMLVLASIAACRIARAQLTA